MFKESGVELPGQVVPMAEEIYDIANYYTYDILSIVNIDCHKYMTLP